MSETPFEASPKGMRNTGQPVAFGAEIPLGATAQNVALGHLILVMLCSLRGCNLHDDRRSYYIYAYNFIFNVDNLSGFITFDCILKLSVLHFQHT